MTIEEFQEEMLDVLNREEDVDLDAKLSDVEEWDSVASVAFLAMAAEYTERRIRAAEVFDAVTVRDLYNIIIKE